MLESTLGLPVISTTNVLGDVAIDSFFAASGHFDRGAFGAENAGAPFTECPVVVDDEGAHFVCVGVVQGGWASDYVKVLSGQGAGHLNPVVRCNVDKRAALNFVIEGTNLAKHLTSAIASLYRLRICGSTQKNTLARFIAC